VSTIVAEQPLAELFDARFVDGHHEVLVLIEEPGDYVPGIGVVRREEWRPLATFQVLHQALLHGDELIGEGITIAEALEAEGWMPPWRAGEDPDLCEAITPKRYRWAIQEVPCRRLRGHSGPHRVGGFTWDGDDG